MKAFISYSTKDKRAGGAVKAIFDDLKIDSFLAHDDLRVSEEWKERILEELKDCTIFVPLLSKAFKQSNWCGQEAGAIVQRGAVLIIPVSLDGTVPYGFLSHIQSHRVAPTDITPRLFLDAIGKKWPAVIIDALLEPVKNANTFRGAEALVAPLVPFFDKFSKVQARNFAETAIANSQIWNADLCRTKYLPRFLQLNKLNIPLGIYKALKYQVEKQSWYAGRNN